MYLGVLVPVDTRTMQALLGLLLMGAAGMQLRRIQR